MAEYGMLVLTLPPGQEPSPEQVSEIRVHYDACRSEIKGRLVELQLPIVAPVVTTLEGVQWGWYARTEEPSV